MLVVFEQVQEVGAVVLVSAVGVPLGSEDVMVLGYSVILKGSSVLISVHGQTLVHFSFEYLDRGLLNGKVCHFDIKAMEMNPLDALRNIVSKSWLANFSQALMIWDRAGLMELSEECVEVVDGPSICHEPVPVARRAHGSVAFLELRNHLLEVPRKGQHVSMLLLIELDVSTYNLVVFGDRSLLGGRLLCGLDSLTKSSGGQKRLSH